MLATAFEASVAPVRITRRPAPGQVPLLPAPACTQCSSCHLKDLCLPGGLADDDIARLEGLQLGRRKVKVGQVLFRHGDEFHFLYAVRSGTFKSAMIAVDGQEQVTGLHLAGDLMGLDGVAQGAHASAAVALEDAEVCAIPYAQLLELTSRNANMRHVVNRLMAREIVREHSVMLLLGSMDAEERLASFLLNVSARLKARGYSEREFHLRMSRAEIGSFLGLKLETVSRTFSSLQQQGLLVVDKKHVRILDMDGLAGALDHSVH